jgi:hypothetical protein
MIEIRNGDDWHQLLIDGDVFAEGHSISDKDWADALRKLGHTVERKLGTFCQNGCGAFLPEGTYECTAGEGCNA